ncbi:hypothetical protein VM1G_07146 [Cytospora mali]|uniref:Ilp is an apoptosis inhibitor n=1 Tax=Cytospora mali TaxID=578113 RepID=A0A194W506_CYTMA|nr:hypothetical protein VM1G_07146 [Valsa mali]
MAFPNHLGGPSFQQPQPFVDAQFDIFEWHGSFQSCVRYFLDHAQHSGPIQAVAAFLNIQLPFQKQPHPIYSSNTTGTPPPHHSLHALHSSVPSGMPGPGPASLASLGKIPMQMLPGPSRQQAYVTLTPYIRRLVATGFDIPSILHGFFGDDWAAGIGPLHEAERRNYLFAAKSDNWLTVKASYDMDGEQIIPFLKPLQNVTEKEIISAETSWSEWLAMQDWMLGPRAPVDIEGRAHGHGPRVGTQGGHH